MEIYLCWNNDEKKIRLPINPSSFKVAASQNNQSVYVHNLGEVSLKGKRGLYGITLESFFPGQKYSFQHGAYHDPYKYYCTKLRRLFRKNETIHLIITDTNINMFCTIESFAYGEADQSGDVSYTLALKEYRMHGTAKRISTKKKEATYTWKKGDTWSKVVKRHMGSSDTWKKVRAANQNVIRKAKKNAPKKKEVDALIGYKVVIK